MSRPVRPLRSVFVAALSLPLLAPPVLAQLPEPLEEIGVPPTATVLEGRPDVRVEATEDRAERRELGEREADDNRLTIKVRNGQLYWGAQEVPLLVNPAGEFVYLSSSTRPGHYIRVRRVNDRLTYVEHLDMGTRNVTYWGELRVVLGR